MNIMLSSPFTANGGVSGNLYKMLSEKRKLVTPSEWISSDFISLNRLYGTSKYVPNVVKKWLPTDTEELFESNMRIPSHAAKLKNFGWTKDSITYSFNNHGFRTPDNWDLENPEEGNIFLGCSVTVGVGINLEDTWAYQISKIVGGKFYNLAQAGTGLETQYRMLRAWGNILKPTRIFTIGSFEPRREFIGDNDTICSVNSWTPGIEENELSAFIFSQKEVDMAVMRSSDALKHVAASIGAQLWCPRFEDVHMATYSKNSGRSARDLAHPGIEFHRVLAGTFENWIRLV